MADTVRDASMGPDLDGDSIHSDTVPLASLPRIRICISRPNLPHVIADGIHEIARHHIRQEAIFLHNDPQPVPADGRSAPTVDDCSASSPARWNWNVRFVEHDSSDGQDPLAWSCSTSSDTFAPTYANASQEDVPAQPVDQPFEIQIKYHRASPHLAFRALGHVLGTAKDALSLSTDLQQTSDLHPNLFPSSSRLRPAYYLSPAIAHKRLNITQRSDYDTIGTMIDCSRNGVLNVRSTKYLLRTLALLGYNMLQLYTEDTYEIQGEPFFGYMRGGYSQAELTEIDDYAVKFGIEVIPCIQTLGHLGQMLQWPRYLGLRDTAEVLLPEWPETYVMLEKMIKAATAPFRSNRIHLGMDETFGLGHGRYYSIYGNQNAKPSSQVFVEHLDKVNRICNTLHLEPMIWSDMLFCLSARNNSLVGYYDSQQPVDVKQHGIPNGVDLVYWDYYHTSSGSYEARIKNHEDLRGASPWMAAGSWTWSRFWTALPFTFQTIHANLTAAKNSPGVRHVFLTTWGDEANEVDLWSSLPAWVYYADHSYTTTFKSGGEESLEVSMVKSKFDAIVGAHWDDFVRASSLDDTSKNAMGVAEDDQIHFAPNTSKWMLWSDPVHSFAEPTLVAAGFDAEQHYASLASTLSERLEGATLEDAQHHRDLLVVRPDQGKQAENKAAKGLFGAAASLISEMTGLNSADTHTGSSKVVRILSDHPFNARLELARLLAHTLCLKANLRQRLHQAYTSRNWPQLQQLNRRTARCLEATRKLWQYHRQVWMSMYKPHGWETVELRYGGLVARLDTLHRRVGAFLEWRLSRHTAEQEEDEEPSVEQGKVVHVAAKRADVFLATPASFDELSPTSSKRSSLEDGREDDDDESMRSGGRRDGQWGWHENVTSLPELEKPLHLVYGSPEQLLDYHRVSRPTYC